MADFIIKQGDTLPSLEATLHDEADDPVNLTNASSIKFLMRQAGKDTWLSKSASIVGPATDGVVKYEWDLGDTIIAGEFQALFEVTFTNGDILTVPTATFISIIVYDDISAVGEDLTPFVLPETTLVVYGTGVFRYTPTVTHEGVPVAGAEVRVITALGTTLGPGITDSNGEVFASDGEGAFKLDPGTYTLTVTSGGVTASYALVIDSNGNGVVS